MAGERERIAQRHREGQHTRRRYAGDPNRPHYFLVTESAALFKVERKILYRALAAAAGDTDNVVVNRIPFMYYAWIITRSTVVLGGT